LHAEASEPKRRLLQIHIDHDHSVNRPSNCGVLSHRILALLGLAVLEHLTQGGQPECR
jgi:hypothetical protein